MRQRYFITATGTGIGKSFITAALGRQARGLGRSVASYKPVISGFDPAQPQDSDAALLLRSLDRPVNEQSIAHISPWRFKAPLAPSMAARQERRAIDFAELITQSRHMIGGQEDVVLIEGVGGVMVPLDDRHTVLDWIIEIAIPIVLVTGGYLGAISHTLTALSVLEQKKIAIRAIVVNESQDASISTAETADELGRRTKAPLITVRRRQAVDGWMDVPELKALL